MRLSFGILKLIVPNTYPRGKTIMYQRSVPTDLRHRYNGKTIKIDLKTSDWAIAARKVTKLNATYESEWNSLRAAPESSPKALKAHAAALLREFGLKPASPDNHPEDVDALIERLDAKLVKFAGGCEETYREAEPKEFLSPVETTALRMLNGQQAPTLSDALELHLSLHTKRDDAKFTTYQKMAFDTLLAIVGDKPVTGFTRDDARTYIEASLEAGSATGTVRRRLGAMRAVFTTWRLEKSPGMPNPFEKLSIANEGKDKKAREPFTLDELAKLHQECRSKNDDIRWLLALLIDTGARLAEVAGLALADIVLEAPVPHIRIQEHPWRTIKNEGSDRKVPLVGASLWAAEQVHARAALSPKQVHAFPRYTNMAECNATAASAALCSWIKRRGLDHVVHELRHSMADRLRNVGCPKEIRYAIDGHASQDVGDDYGSGHGLPILADWLGKVALTN